MQALIRAPKSIDQGDAPAVAHATWRTGFDSGAVGVWLLVGPITLYLAIDGGGYDPVVRNQVGILVWWAVLAVAVFGLLPATRLTRHALAALMLFGGFVSWTGLASLWSISSERGLEELSRLACYVGILMIALTLYRDRARVLRHTVAALACAILLAAALAVLSRLVPGLIPASHQTGSFLPDARNRLAWPLNYWNGLGALVALGLPLLLSVATSARTVLGRGLAATGLPVLVLCGYLTFSRGGAIEAAVALIVFLLLSSDRLAAIVSVCVATVASAGLIAAAVHSRAIEQGLTDAAARHQGVSLLIAVILVCAGAGLAQAALTAGARRGRIPRLPALSREARRTAALITAACCVAAFLIAGGPARIGHVWRDFKRPNAAALNQSSIGRFGVASGHGRYDLWKGAIDATAGHVLAGSGPGTFQLLWLPRAPYASYAQNAHSLYLETLAETGVIGLSLLVGFLGLALGAAITWARRASGEARTRAAGAAAAICAFLIAAAVDWVWQIPVLPVAFLLLAAAVLAPESRPVAVGGRVPPASSEERSPLRRRLMLAAVSVVALLAISVPLATDLSVRRSRAEASNGNLPRALSAARQALRLEPDAASAQLQVALVLELEGKIPAALSAAMVAARDEPANWSTWLVVSRLQAERGHPAASLAAFERARSLNPKSFLFSTATQSGSPKS